MIEQIEEKQMKLTIPQCCLEGWPSCPHVTKKYRPQKRNVGL